MACAAIALLFLALDVCEQCAPGKADSALCEPHAAALEEALALHRRASKSSDPAERLASLAELAARNQAHENAPSRAATRALGQALEDPDPRVRAAAVSALVDRQHADEAVSAFEERLESLQKETEKIGEPLIEVLTTDREALGTAPAEVALQGMFEERASVVTALGLLDTADARKAILRAVEGWDFDLELALVAALAACGRENGADPLRARALISTVGATASRRHAEALVELSERLGKHFQQALRDNPRPPAGKQGTEDLPELLEFVQESQLGILRSGAAIDVRFLVLEELTRFGERAGFSPAPEDGTWRAWIRENAAKLAPAGTSGPGK